jgi:hypothetical protein
VRLSLVLEALPEGANDVVLRARTKTRSGFSGWSEPTAVITVPALPPRERRSASADATGTNDRPQQRGLSAGDLDEYHALREALQPMLGPDLPLDEAVRPFRRVRDLAEAVVLSRRHKLQFASLLKAVEGPPSRSLREALRLVEPSLDARRASRDARDEARALAARKPR